MLIASFFLFFASILHIHRSCKRQNVAAAERCGVILVLKRNRFVCCETSFTSWDNFGACGSTCMCNSPISLDDFTRRRQMERYILFGFFVLFFLPGNYVLF